VWIKIVVHGGLVDNLNLFPNSLSMSGYRRIFLSRERGGDTLCAKWGIVDLPGEIPVYF
jgi:hypothetical protein